MSVVVLTGGALNAIGSAGPEAGVTTSLPVEFSGAVTLAAEADALLLHPLESSPGTHLQADRIVVEYQWEQGVDVSDDSALFRHRTERGEGTVSFTDAEVRLEPMPADPLALAYAPGGLLDVEIHSATGHSIVATANETPVRIGTSPQAVSASGTELGFWHSIDDWSVKGHGGGTVSIVGSYTLFVHDVVIHVAANEGTWSKWTGYRTSSPGSPVTEYEFRITRLQITNGTFSGGSADGVAAYARSVDARFDGSVSSHEVSGAFVHRGERFLFDRDPLHLEGTGEVTVGVALPNSWENASGFLDVRPEGSFDVRGARVVEPWDQDGGASEWVALVLSSLGGVALVATAGMMALGVVPAPIPAVRRNQFDFWMRLGDKANEKGEPQKASRRFKRATRVMRNEPLAWYEWAKAELDSGNGNRAETVALKAATVSGVDPLDVLELRIAAAWHRGDLRLFNVLLEELAREAPEMALGLVIDLEIDPFLVDARSAGLIEGQHDEGGFAGYA